MTLHQTCAFCEYFDGGGLIHVINSRNGNQLAGDRIE